MDKKDLIKKIKSISGPLKTPGDFIYGSYHLPEFEVDGWRNTLKRFNFFGVHKNLSGFNVLDIGSNTGALSIEAARRGATVYGLEYNKNRVDLCNEIAKKFDLKASFSSCDFREDWIAPNNIDIVFCCAVDLYIQDKKTFFQKIIDINPNICYLEINTKKLTDKEIYKYFENEYNIETLSKLDGRRNFILHKEKAIYPIYSYQLFSKLSQRFSENRKLLRGFKHRQNTTHLTEKDYIYKKYENKKQYEFLKSICQNIKNKNIVPIEFIDDIKLVSKSPFVEGKTLGEILKKENIKNTHKTQLLDLISELNSAGFAHNDMHRMNIIINNNDDLIVIDWDTANIDVTTSFDTAADLIGLKQNHYLKNNNLEKTLGLGILNTWLKPGVSRSEKPKNIIKMI